MSNPQRLPTFMRINEGWLAQAKVEKILGTFVANNVCRDNEGSLRIPTPFINEFGSNMPYYLQLRCDNTMWHATFEQKRKKICGLYDFFRYYDLRMYSLVIFYYYGKGIFVVRGYTQNATEAVKPHVDVVDFWKTFDPSQLRLDEFIYGRNDIEIERYISISAMSAMNQNVGYFKIEIGGVSNISANAYLELKPELQELYKHWTGREHIYLCPGMKMWEISVSVVGGVCRLGHGWYQFVKDFGIGDGDVLILSEGEEPYIVEVCMFKKNDLDAEKEAGERYGGRSFYKIILETAIENGYVVLPPFIGGETEKSLLMVRKLKLYNKEWEIRYNEQYRIIYGLEKIVHYYGLRIFDVVFFMFDKNGELCGRIFRTDGMEVTVSEAGKSGGEFSIEDYFLFEEKNHNMRLDYADGKIMNVVKQVPLPPVVVNIPDLVENRHIEPEVVDLPPENQQDVDMEIDDEPPVQQFSKQLNESNMNGRCHGMHIPPHIRLGNRKWQHRDDVVFRTGAGTWHVGLVLNNGKARFSRGWSIFVRENKLKKNQRVRFTLHQEEDHAVFDVDFP